MNLQPIRDCVIVSKEESPKQTAGGLYMPDTVEDRVINGTVVAVGSGRLSQEGTVVPLEVKVGDRIAFNRHSGTELKAGDQTYLLLKEDSVLCVIK